MDAPAIERGATSGFEDVTDVQEPGFVITADRDCGAGSFDLIQDSAAKEVYISCFRDVRKIRAADAQVKYSRLITGEIDIDDGSDFVRALSQPVYDDRGPLAGGHATSVSERVVSKGRVDSGKPFQEIPSRTFAYSQVGVVRLVPRLDCGVYNTNAQSHAHEAIQDFELRFGNRELIVIPGYYMAGGSEGIALVEDCISEGHRELTDRVGLDQIAKIYYAGDASSAGLAARDQNIVVVGVVVND
jgi:hypothetical protein